MNDTQNSVTSDRVNYRLLRIANDRFGLPPKELNSEQWQDAYAIAEREYFLEQAVLASPEARQVVVPESQVKKAFAKIRERYEDDEAFEQALEENDLPGDDLTLALERELRVDAVLDFISSAIPEVDDTEIGLFYYVHLDKFRQPEIRTARHILITVNEDFPENTANEARARLSKIADRIRKLPHRFAEQALKHSECPTSLDGGLLGRVKPGTLYPQLDEVLFNLPVGTLSSIVESPIGLHVLLCDHIEPENVVPLAEVLEKLRQQLTQRQRSQHQKKWLQNILKSSIAPTHSPDAETIPWPKKQGQK